ncbi:hypothetical protein EVJ58_g1009 [Rhodofomes roseus]|uniref:Uncharacterized protein n=1 Tax=Rhodofomes roseus TaxID=34475 RepID=A0A4Y9Z397_9APHY|nr:hypothetical protein EVJ58_g1009 [Rhodofomes roseus]
MKPTDTLPFSTANLPFDCSFGSHSHKFWQDLNEKDADRTLLALDIIDDSLYREASKCDGGECAFTGPRIGNVHWIFPPSLISTMTTPAAERLFVLLEADFQESHNLLNMEDDIYQLWHQNAFSVDVDDDYRIRIFDKKAMNAGLPSHLKHIPAGGASDLYFHEHFRHTLTLHLCGGDMGENVGHMDYNLKDNTLTAAVRKCLEEKKLEEGVKELIVRDYEEYELEKRLKAANVWSEDDGETEEDCEPAE